MPKVPYWNKIKCYRCGKDHFANQCPRNRQLGLQLADKRTFALNFIFGEQRIYSHVSLLQTLWGPQLSDEINLIPVNCPIDSGAFLSVILHTLATFMGVSPEVDFQPQRMIESFTGHIHPWKGSVKVAYKALGVKTEIHAQILDIPSTGMILFEVGLPPRSYTTKLLMPNLQNCDNTSKI